MSSTKLPAEHRAPFIQEGTLAGTPLVSVPASGGGSAVFLAQNGFVADSIVDGPGLRCTLFVQGCPHACPGCHNPATWPFEGGVAAEPAELAARVAAQPLCAGVTFSGGEPFCQAEALAELAARLRAAGRWELAAYTGYTYEELAAGTAAQRRLLSFLDILVDGPFIEARRNLTLRFCGSENQRILNVPKSLAAGGAVWESAARWVKGSR